MSTWLISTNGLLLTAGNGLPSVGATPPPVATASAEITVSKRLVTATAPDMVVFEITNLSGFDTSGPGVGETYDARLHDLYYFWDFGDTTYSSFTAPRRVRSDHNNPNRMYGPWGRHVYRNAGSYSPKCTIYEPSSGKFAVAYLNAASADSGTAGTATAALDVADPDTTFASTATVFMSPSGSFSNAPGGATTVTSADIDAVMASNISGAGGPRRLMLNRGESYTLSGLSLSSSYPTVHIVAGGDAGAKPIVTPTSGFTYTDSSDNTKDFVFDGIDWNGPYDSTTDTGGAVSVFTQQFGNTTTPATVLFHLCDFSGFDTFSLDLGEQPYHIAVVDCTVTDWAEAGLYNSGVSYTTILGSRLNSQQLALADAAGNMGAPYRHTTGGTVVVYASDIFSKQGFSGLGNGDRAYQATLRLNAEAATDVKTYVGGCILEGGWRTVEYRQAGGQYVSSTGNHIFEKNTLIATSITSSFISSTYSGLTIRNNLFNVPAITYSPSVAMGDYIGFGFQASDANDFPADMRADPNFIYCNTFVNELHSGSIPDFWTTDPTYPWSNVTVQNNIHHTPNLSGGSDLTLADTTNDFLPLHLGYLDSTTPIRREELTPHKALDFDAQTAAFAAGALLEGGTSGATAYIGYVDDNGTTGTLYLGEITGTFLNDETITDGSGGSATVNGTARDSGVGDDYAPLTGSSVIGTYTTGKVAYDDFYGNIRDTVLSGLTRSAYSTGAHEPALES